jgi:hypothetical protein
MTEPIKPMLHADEYVLTAAQVMRLGSLWNGPLELSPDGGYRPAPCRSGGSIQRPMDDDDD